jgi:hypothetical protein
MKKRIGLLVEMTLTRESMFLDFGTTMAVAMALAAALMAVAMAFVTDVVARKVLSATAMTMVTVWSLHRLDIGRRLFPVLLEFSLTDVHCLRRVSLLLLCECSLFFVGFSFYER